MGESNHEPRTEPTDIQRTNSAEYEGQSAGESGWTSTDLAARALGVSPRSVRRFIDRGELEGRKVKEGIVESWEVSIASLYTLRNKRKLEGQPEGQVRRSVPRVSAEPETMSAMVQDLTTDLIRRTAEAAELRTRLELTERTESSLREDLEREREERQRHQEEARRLREELATERSKGFWRRLFGRA